MAAKKEKKVRIELVRGLAACLPNQRATVKALGLGKVGSSVVRKADAVTMGMVRVVEHLVKVEEAK